MYAERVAFRIIVAHISRHIYIYLFYEFSCRRAACMMRFERGSLNWTPSYDVFLCYMRVPSSALYAMMVWLRYIVRAGFGIRAVCAVPNAMTRIIIRNYRWIWWNYCFGARICVYMDNIFFFSFLELTYHKISHLQHLGQYSNSHSFKWSGDIQFAFQVRTQTCFRASTFYAISCV